MKVAIVGAGIAGLSLAWALRSRDVSVSLFEQGPIPNPVSSSFDEHRITRHTYGDLTGYGAMMPAAFAICDQLWADLGVSHYNATGMAYVTRSGADPYPGIAAELDGMGILHRRLDADEIAARLPMINAEGIASAFEAQGAGMLFASRIITDLAGWVEENGVEMHPNSLVEDVDVDTGRFKANGDIFHADMVVIAAGAWLPQLWPGVSGRLVPSRQTLLYLKPPERLATAWANAPVIADQGSGHGAYILPPRAGTRLKLGDHRFTRIGQGGDDRIARSEDLAPVLAGARDVLAGFDDYEIVETKVCYYTVTEDERFVVEPIGPAAWVLSACSGHGFKFGPLIAQGLADALTGRRNAADVTNWAAGRA